MGVGKLRLLTYLALGYLAISGAWAKQVESNTGAGTCFQCEVDALKKSVSPLHQDLSRISPFPSETKVKSRKPIMQLSTVIGQAPIVNLNLQGSESEYDVSTGICKITVPNSGTGTATFVGGDLNMLVTNMHGFTDKGRVVEMVQGVRLQCGSHGHPASYDLDAAVDVKVEKQGDYNLTGKKEHREQDVVLLSVIDQERVFKNYKHISYSITQPAFEIEDIVRMIRPGGKGRLQLASYPGESVSIPAKAGPVDLNADEIITGYSCKVLKDYGGFWTHNCPTVPGSSGGVAFINRGKRPPIFVGINAGGAMNANPEGGNQGSPVYLEGEDDGVNTLIPAESIQKVIQKGDNTLWLKLMDAETNGESTSGISSGGSNDAADFAAKRVSPVPPRKSESAQPVRMGF